MPYSTVLHAILATLVIDDARSQLRSLFRTQLCGDLEAIVDVVVEFFATPVAPAAMTRFEERVAEGLCEVGRRLMAVSLNRVEPAAEQLPASLRWDGGDYRRLNQATANRHVATCFGTITLMRHGYRPHDRDSGEATIFPLEQALGLTESATPAFAKRVGRYLAEAGATQDRVLERLSAEHGVSMGVKRLRSLASSLSEAMTPHRHDAQVERVLDLLEQAHASKGSRKPVLAVGRDGITLGTQPLGRYEVASVATVTVYDRRRRRLGTVQLARVPEPGQGTLSGELTRLVEDVLRRWDERRRPLPRLCYVTDAGDNEVSYFRRTLRRLRHPRTGKKLRWQWIVDYYHATERISVLADLLFGPGREGQAWARKMRKLLLKPSGVRRVLLSAAALRTTRGLRAKHEPAYRRAYNYLRARSRHMDYHGFRRLGLPIGSGVTEAACKTVFTQRLKLSGMRWKGPGAQVILNLRVILLSGIWDEVHARTSAAQSQAQTRTHACCEANQACMAA
jgi:hypothetical protein